MNYMKPMAKALGVDVGEAFMLTGYNHRYFRITKNGVEYSFVLSMYDGIGTGRYCLEKMGFTNVEYHAYEIDKYAMTVTASNYPDVIQHGDAFALRDENWAL